VRLDDGAEVLDIVCGESVFVPAATSAVLVTTAAGATLFRAVPGL